MYVTDVTSGVNKEYLSATTQFLDRFNKDISSSRAARYHVRATFRFCLIPRKIFFCTNQVQC